MVDRVSFGYQLATKNWEGFIKWLILLVGMRGFEPPTPSSRTKCATRLRYIPTLYSMAIPRYG